MSKKLNKLVDINGLREFKNKLVGTDSAYVQTTAVDQTIAGTKTFSKPIVGSVTGSSGSCTGNAASANSAVTANSAKSVRTPDNSNTITFDWGSQVSGCVGITVDVTRMGGIITTNRLVSDIRAHILSMVYPVGSVYISVNDVSPEKFLGGKWVKISQGRVLQGASGTQTAGTEVSAGLPNISVTWNGEHTHTRGSMNITGGIAMHGANTCTDIADSSGAFYGTNINNSYHGADCYSGASSQGLINFSADRTWTGSTSSAGAHSHSAYITGITGNSTTVQPPALLVNIWKRTA